MVQWFHLFESRARVRIRVSLNIHFAAKSDVLAISYRTSGQERRRSMGSEGARPSGGAAGEATTGRPQQQQQSSASSWLLPQVLCIVSAHLTLRDVCGLLCVNTACRHVLTSHAALWKRLSLSGLARAGERMVSALSLRRYADVEEIDLEFARDVDDAHVQAVAVRNLRKLNLNACQKLSDAAVEAVAATNPKLRSFSMYWNLRLTDRGVDCLVQSCNALTDLNLSGCKSITDGSLRSIAAHCPGVARLNLTRCLKLTDDGLTALLTSCKNLQELYLYAIPNFTDKAFGAFSGARELRLLDVCGAQYLTDDGMAAIAQCSKLISLNLTWCVRVTSASLVALGRNCSALEVLSLHGLLGVTDDGLEKLAQSCGSSLHSLDVNGCVNIRRRSREDLLQLFPNLKTFVIHT